MHLCPHLYLAALSHTGLHIREHFYFLYYPLTLLIVFKILQRAQGKSETFQKDLNKTQQLCQEEGNPSTCMFMFTLGRSVGTGLLRSVSSSFSFRNASSKAEKGKKVSCWFVTVELSDLNLHSSSTSIPTPWKKAEGWDKLLAQLSMQLWSLQTVPTSLQQCGTPAHSFTQPVTVTKQAASVNYLWPKTHTMKNCGFSLVPLSLERSCFQLNRESWRILLSQCWVKLSLCIHSKGAF